MSTPTFQQQFDKLTIAYIQGLIDPWNCKACFVGNLLNNTSAWAGVTCTSYKTVETGIWRLFEPDDYRSNSILVSGILAINQESNGLYSPEDIAKIEATFLYEINKNGGNVHAWGLERDKIKSQDEDALFTAFEKTLELLKSIHESKGEVIDNAPIFQKRQLQLS